MSSGNFLPHGRQKTLGLKKKVENTTIVNFFIGNLWIEKAGHPEDSWTPGEAPGPELAVSLKQLGEPAS